MPIQLNISQPTGVVATYHVINNSIANFGIGAGLNASVNISSYLSSAAYQDGDQPLGGFSQDISVLVQNPIVPAPSLLSFIESYLLTLQNFAGGSQVS